MRVYLPIGWGQLAQVDRTGELAAPLPGFAVDPAWRTGSPEVDEEQWEYEAQTLAADALPADGGVVLAVDLDPMPDLAIADGTLVVAGSVPRRRVAAVLGADLAWYGVQEIAALVAEHSGA